MRLDLTGKRFTRLTVEGFAEERNGSAIWRARCDCGNEKMASSSNLRAGHTKSCGCLRRELGVQRGKTFNRAHGHAVDRLGSPTYQTWRAMLNRCTNPKNIAFQNYGGRGVTVYGPWFDFNRFVADVGERPDGHTLDRINPHGNYEPSNVRWATPQQQARNTRKNWSKQ